MSSKAHAQHNKEVCEFLLSSSKYYDWVVTTAFYSALHYVQSKIFPFTEDSQTFNNIDEYLPYLKVKTGREPSKHNATIKLVNKAIPVVRTEYRKLHDTCMNARYHRYKVQKSSAEDAIAELLLIEQACQ